MQTLWHRAFALLCTLSFLFAGHSKQCSEVQYSWPVDSHSLCCDKCPPGQYNSKREAKSCFIQCRPCPTYKYIDTYNVDFGCKSCDRCDEDNKEVRLPCNATRNTVCKCKTGYRCEDQRCTQCVPVPTPTTTLPPSTTAWTPLSTIRTVRRPVADTGGMLVIIVLLCIGIAFVAVTKIKPFLGWIRSKQDYFLVEKPARVATCSTDEEVSTPVQEVCGKCDQPIDV